MIPFANFFQDASREARYVILRLFGVQTSQRKVALATVAISLGGGISEEIFFRGFLFSLMYKSLGGMGALIISSLAFAVARFPVFGTNVILEFLYGVILALVFTTSGNNSLVPIVLHTVYDFFSIFLTWKLNSADLRERFFNEKTAELTNESLEDPFLFKEISHSVTDSCYPYCYPNPYCYQYL
jgi:membrane protease YdiL (CAAX protease family)